MSEVKLCEKPSKRGEKNRSGAKRDFKAGAECLLAKEAQAEWLLPSHVGVQRPVNFSKKNKHSTSEKTHKRRGKILARSSLSSPAKLQEKPQCVKGNLSKLQRRGGHKRNKHAGMAKEAVGCRLSCHQGCRGSRAADTPDSRSHSVSCGVQRLSRTYLAQT